MPPELSLPLQVRVPMTHAAMQVLADASGADLLHIKGPALDRELAERRPPSSDADILVRPAHLRRFVRALAGTQWSLRTRFATGSAFQHAATYWSDVFGYVDVHRSFPGLEALDTFDVLWADRHTVELGGHACAVPDVTAQRLILLVHAARSGGSRDVEISWDEADPDEQSRIRDLARRLDAEIALAGALGRLDEYRDHRAYRLWRTFADPTSTRWDELRGRVEANPRLLGKAEILLRALVPNFEHLQMAAGHRLSRRDRAYAWQERYRRAWRELRRTTP